MVVLAGLGLWVRSGDDARPAAQLPPASPTERSADSESSGPSGFSTTLRPVHIGPPPWVRYETPLEGRWVSGTGSQRVTLLVSNMSFDLWQGIGQRQGAPTSRHEMIVLGDQVLIHSLGGDDFTTYLWHIAGGLLTFQRLDAPDPTDDLLTASPFRLAG